MEGSFVAEQPHHPHFLESKLAEACAHLLKVMQPEELEDIRLNQQQRRQLMASLENYYALHVPDFGTMKSLPVLKEILS